MMKVFSKKIIVSFVLAAGFTTIFRAEVSLVDLKGLSTSLQEKYQEISPVLGALYWDAGYIENLYRYGDKESAAVKLVRKLFFLHPDGITFDVTHAPNNIGKYLGAEDIGKIVGYIFMYNKSYGQGNLDEKQKTELIVQLRGNIEENVLDPIQKKENLDKRSMRNFRSPLFNSLPEEIGISDKPLYIKNNTITFLLSFLWKKAKTKEAFEDFFEGFYSAAGIDGRDFFKNKALLNQKYTENDYIILKDKPYDQIKGLSLEDFVFLFLAKDIYDGIPLPEEVSVAGGVEYKGKFFTDCCETALRNFFSALLYEPKTRKFDVKLLEKLKAKQELIGFYTKYRTQEQINTHQAHNDWAQVVSELSGVNYVGDKGCEIKTGISNMLKVINNLIPSITTFDKFADELKKYGITMDTKSSYPLDDQPYDANNTITFEIKKDVDPFSLTWKFQQNHSVVIYPLFQKDLFENYKKFFLDNVVQPNSFKQATYCALFACFERALGKVLTEIENKITEYRGIYEYQVLLLQSMKTPERKIDVIELLKSKQILSIPQLESSIQNFLFVIHLSLPVDEVIQGDFFESVLDLRSKSAYFAIKQILEKSPNEKVIIWAIEKVLGSELSSNKENQDLFKELFASIAKIIPKITDNEGKYAIVRAVLFSEDYSNGECQDLFKELYAKVKWLIPTITGSNNKYLVIGAILGCYANAEEVYQESFKGLYTTIAEIIPTIEDDNTRYNVIEEILESRAYSDVAYQDSFKKLYFEVTKLISTITNAKKKDLLIKEVLNHPAYKDPVYKKSFKELKEF